MKNFLVPLLLSLDSIFNPSMPTYVTIFTSSTYWYIFHIKNLNDNFLQEVALSIFISKDHYEAIKDIIKTRNKNNLRTHGVE